MRKARNCDYVCPYCFNRPNKCTCKCYAMSLILIDREIQASIQKLNKMGIITVDSCSGHFDDKIPNLYISFRNKINTAPSEFNLEKSSNVVRYIYKNLSDRKEFKKEQEEAIKNLETWINEMK